MERATPILVYQMGKVGSSSVFKSLDALHDGWVIQLHDYQPHEYTRRKLRRRMVFDFATKEKQQIKVITLTREPVGRNVACLFENFVQWTGRSWNDPDISIELLKDYFINNLDHKEPLRWFDENLNAHFGIDCYAKPFSENGFQFYEHGSVSVLAMQCELPDPTKEELIDDFVGLSGFHLKHVNVGSEKPYKELYREFKEKVRFSSSYLKMMCESRYFKHFYKQAVIDEVHDRWVNH